MSKKEKKLIFVKAVGKLLPVDDIAEEALAAIKYGEEVAIEIKKPHNIKLFKRYWALVNIVWQNQDRYETRDQVHTALKLSTGIYDQIELPGGVIYKVPGSVSFDSMDAVEFHQFWKRVCDVIATHYLPGVSNEWLQEEVEKLIGARF
jgi:hypothetical protein